MLRLVLATDLSPGSDRALRRAILLARETGARLILAHALSPEARMGGEASSVPVASQLERLARTLNETEGVTAEAVTRVGTPEDVVASLARERDSDLIILGPHRPRPLLDHFSIQAAQRIARAAQTPLLVVNSLPSGSWSRILVASDLTETGDRAMALIGDRCFSPRAAVLLFHGFEPYPAGFIGASGMTAADRSAELARSEREADEALLRAALKAGLESARRIVQPLLQGPAQSVVRAASELGADLLVVGTRRRSGVERLLMGSVAEAAMSEAGSDLLIIPSD